MDLRSLCQKLDVDSIRAKLPQLPGLPSLPQIKLPKALPKLKSRKIFRSSRENVNRNSPENQKPTSVQHLPPPPIAHPSANFVKHTPSRISTISSLMHEESYEESSYRSAGSIDDDYALPTFESRSSGGAILPLSPVRAATIGSETMPAGMGGSRMSLSERLHRSYRDFTEFRFKHIFSKKTVVRKDSIRVQHYVTNYEEERARERKEQARRDSAIAENYTFRFKVSRQNIDHSNSVTPDDSPRFVGRSGRRTVGELSGDESGMEATPPPRKPGIAATRFARVRNPPLRQSSSEREEEQQIPRPEANESSLYAIQKKKQQQIQSQLSDNEVPPQPTAKKLSYKQRMQRLTGYVSGQDDSDGGEKSGRMKMISTLKGFGRSSEAAKGEVKRKSPGSPRSSDEDQPKTSELPDSGSPTSRAFRNFRHNFKRLQQSIKAHSQQQHAATDESGDESGGAAAPKSGIASKTERLTTRLRRFHSRDVSVEDLDADEETQAKRSSPQSPIRQRISNKLESWKKSFKKHSNPKPDETSEVDGETSPEKPKPRSETLIRRLKHIRARKAMGSKDDLDTPNTDGEANDGDGTGQKPKSRAAKFHEARQRTFKKVNEKMHQIRFFQKSQSRGEAHATPADHDGAEKRSESEEESEEEASQHEESRGNLPPKITRRDFPPPHDGSPEQESLHRGVAPPCVHSAIHIPSARAAWSTKPILSQSVDSDMDPSDLPRVLIHQDNSDSFESTLIIAVTRPRISAPTPMGAIITEIKSSADDLPPQQDWVPNQKIIAEFLGTAPPRIRRKNSLESNPPLSGHKRKLSMDSSTNSDSDSSMPENKGPKTTSHRAFQGGLVSIDEKSEAWKVRRPSDPEPHADHQTLYKSKSIDIFEKNALKGGVLTAFEDFDEELRDEPVQRIRTVRNTDSCGRESSEDTADEDSSSRVSKISANQDIKKESKEIDSKKRNLLQYGNSRESLVANFDENDEDDENSSNEDEEDDEEEDDDDDDRPPSAAPSPPPIISPPPPPLPQRKPSGKSSLVRRPTETPPPLPKSKPPPLPPSVHPTSVSVPPPRIPERTSSIPRAPRPLVKTSSLRLVYSEQVKPSDVGKVNKLISKFEPTEGNAVQRPRVISRRIPDDSEDYSDDEEDYAAMAIKLKERYANIKIDRDSTPTPTPTNTPSQSTPEAKVSPAFPLPTEIRMRRELIVPVVVTTTDEDNNVQILSQPHLGMRPTDLPSVDANSNSQTNSEYGSPLEFPSSLRGSLETIPTLERREANGEGLRSSDRHYARSRRSMTRDNENYYSFDSDEENSYYSISSTGSNRYIVDI